MMIKKILLISICMLISNMLNAQAKKKSSFDYAYYPYWIKMMDDPNANFFEVEKAFEIYFSKHALPEAEHDVIGEFKEREKFPSKRAIRKSKLENKLRMQVKKYNWWHEDNLPYVQSNGHILNAEERVRLHQQLIQKN